MKTRLWEIILAVLLLPAFTQAVTFTSDANIQAGDSWSSVSIYDTPPAHTTVNMTGGVITDGGVHVYNAATFNFSGGTMYGGGIEAHDQSTVNITSSVKGVGVFDNATVNIFNNANVSMADTYGVLNVYGGTIGQLSGYASAIVNLHGGDITNYISVEPSGSINVFGYDLAKTDTGGTYGYGQITGFWQDALPFTINLAGSGAYSAINLIPEPTTLLLLGIGAFLLRKSRK
jgi:hypothetical protein